MTKLGYGNEHTQPVEADHEGMVKFKDENDPFYEVLKFKLEDMAAYGLNTRATRRGM